MPWHESDPVNERVKFVASWQSQEMTRVELCTRFGISRRTGYRIVERYAHEDPEGLRDQSRAVSAHRHLNQTA
jgi:transposase